MTYDWNFLSQRKIIDPYIKDVLYGADVKSEKVLHNALYRAFRVLLLSPADLNSIPKDQLDHLISELSSQIMEMVEGYEVDEEEEDTDLVDDVAYLLVDELKALNLAVCLPTMSMLEGICYGSSQRCKYCPCE